MVVLVRTEMESGSGLKVLVEENLVLEAFCERPFENKKKVLTPRKSTQFHIPVSFTQFYAHIEYGLGCIYCYYKPEKK